MDIKTYCTTLADRAVAASRKLMATPGAERAAALRLMADRLIAQSAALKDANAKDVAAAQQAGLSPALIQRLKLDDKAIKGMADAVRQIADQTDPIGQVVEGC